MTVFKYVRDKSHLFETESGNKIFLVEVKSIFGINLFGVKHVCAIKNVSARHFKHGFSAVVRLVHGGGHGFGGDKRSVRKQHHYIVATLFDVRTHKRGKLLIALKVRNVRFRVRKGKRNPFQHGFAENFDF